MFDNKRLKKMIFIQIVGFIAGIPIVLISAYFAMLSIIMIMFRKEDKNG